MSGFVLAVGPDGKKRRVPEHYLTNPALGPWKRPPSERAQENTPPEKPATTGTTKHVKEAPNEGRI